MKKTFVVSLNISEIKCQLRTDVEGFIKGSGYFLYLNSIHFQRKILYNLFKLYYS